MRILVCLHYMCMSSAILQLLTLSMIINYFYQYITHKRIRYISPVARSGCTPCRSIAYSIRFLLYLCSLLYLILSQSISRSSYCFGQRRQQIIAVTPVRLRRMRDKYEPYSSSIYSCSLILFTYACIYFPDLFASSYSTPYFQKLKRFLPILLKVLNLLGLGIKNPARLRGSASVSSKKVTKMKINLIILQRAMQFSQDKISDFIRFKLNNPHALQEEMRLIEDRLECNRKLQDYTKEMESLKNQLSNGKSALQALVARREYIVNVSDEQKFELQTQISECR